MKIQFFNFGSSTIALTADTSSNLSYVSKYCTVQMFYTTSLTGTYTRIINRTTWYDNMTFAQTANYIGQQTANNMTISNYIITKQ